MQFALKLAADLENVGFPIWIDRKKSRINASDDWRLVIQKALDRSECAGLICILSNAFLNKKFCRQELALAEQHSIPIYPIVYDQFDPLKKPLEVIRIHHIPFGPNLEGASYKKSFLSLTKSLKENHEYNNRKVPDQETQYLNTLIADLETKLGVKEYIELEGNTTDRQKPPVIDEFGYSLLLENQEENYNNSKAVKVPARQALDVNNRIVITGDPGSGKTTAIRRITLDLAYRSLDLKNNTPIPLLCYLPAWEKPLTFVEFLESEWPLDKVLLAELKNNNCILLLDGLNEMGLNTESHIQEMTSFFQEVESLSCIVCSRETTYQKYRINNQFKSFVHLKLLPLEEFQIREFASNYLGEEVEQTVSIVILKVILQINQKF